VTTFAIAVATVMWFQPVAIGLLALPLMAVFAAYRRYSAQRAWCRSAWTPSTRR
jgi:hypothetical protein